MILTVSELRIEWFVLCAPRGLKEQCRSYCICAYCCVTLMIVWPYITPQILMVWL